MAQHVACQFCVITASLQQVEEEAFYDFIMENEVHFCCQEQFPVMKKTSLKLESLGNHKINSYDRKQET